MDNSNNNVNDKLNNEVIHYKCTNCGRNQSRITPLLCVVCKRRKCLECMGGTKIICCQTCAVWGWGLNK